MWNRKTLIVYAAIATAVALAGCGRGPISGTYRADCLTGLPMNYSSSTPAYYPGVQTQILSMRAELKFSGQDGVKSKLTAFSSQDCSGTPNSEMEITGKYTLGNVMQTAPTQPGYGQAAVGGQSIDFRIEHVKVTRKTHEQTAVSNTYRECGIGDWQINKKREVTGTDCADDWGIARSPYTVISILGDRIYLGDGSYGSGGGYGGGGKTAEQRVTFLSNQPYIRR